ncbi:MAG: hypothetical protein PHY43_11150 [Verrucomicrobiales bacterium]|nr:hypothetical protein [Verrucomicrobiales bacterium]
MSIAGIKRHFTNWREWEFNPIVIKELRQGVRSWTVTGMLMLFLVVLFIASVGFLVTQSFNASPDLALGGSMFSTFIVILAGASFFFIPLYIGVRVASERQDNNPDLLYVTTLSPARIIFGKFLCGAYIALLFFSACMPFMAFTNLLRGVDLPTVFFILGFLFLVVCAANMIAIFLACLPVSRPFRFLFILYSVFQSIALISSLVATSFRMMRSGIGAMMAGRDFWIGTLTVVGIGVAATGLFFVMAVALISPQSTNRALPVRIYLTIIWLLAGLVSFGWVVQTGDVRLMSAWTYPTFIVMMLALLVAISNADQLSLRVRRTIPQSGLKRVAAFFFFNGAAGGLIWVAAIMALTFSATKTLLLAFPTSATTGDENESWFTTTAIYAFAYALTALLIHRKFLPKRPHKLAGLLAVLLAGAWAIVPSIVLFFLNQLSWKSVEGLQLGNMFNVTPRLDTGQRLLHFIFATIWLVIMVLLNAKWFLAQVKNFHPLQRDVAPPPMLE